MILRLVRGTLNDGAASDLVLGLRSHGVPQRIDQKGRRAYVFGFRRVGSDVHFLALSAWDDFGAMADGVGGDITRPDPTLEALAPGALKPSHFELVDKALVDASAFDTPVVGVVTGRIRVNEESAVHAMIRAVDDEVREAGVVDLHIGRRVIGSRTDLVVLALWRDRAALHRFASSRSRPTIDPRFRERLENFDFRTYDCVTPNRLLVPSTGPAILLADDDRVYVDASPGFEAVLGVPGELLLRMRVDDLAPEELRSQVAPMWADFVARGSMEGMFTLQRLDGSVAEVPFRAAANVPSPGFHASVFDVPGVQRDERDVADIVADVFPAFEAAAA